MTACVIMHNMIVEDERDESIFDQGFDYQGENVEPLHQEPAGIVCPIPPWDAWLAHSFESSKWLGWARVGSHWQPIDVLVQFMFSQDNFDLVVKLFY